MIVAGKGPTSRLLAFLNTRELINVTPAPLNGSANVKGKDRRQKGPLLLKLYAPLITNSSF